MSIRMKLANWLSGEDMQSLSDENRILKVACERFKYANSGLEEQRRNAREQIASLESALKRIYDTPCGPKSNGTQRKIRRIAAHALWKE